MIRRRALITSGLLGGGFFFLYLFTAPSDSMVPSDSVIMLGVAEEIIANGFCRATEADTTERYSKYGLGQSLLDLLVVKAYAIGKKTFTEERIFYSLAISILSAVTSACVVSLFFLASQSLGFAPRSGVVSAIALGAGTMTWFYSQMPQSDATVSLCWMIAFYGLIRYKENASAISLVIAGVAVGFALITKAMAIIAIPIYGLYWRHITAVHTEFVGRSKIRRHFFCFWVPIVIFTGILLWYNHLRYGNIFDNGYHSGRDELYGFNTPLWVGLYGLLLSSGKGYFFYNPVTLAGFLGLPRFYKRFRAETLLIAALIGGVIVVHTKWWAWHGDWSWGPRFLVSISPLLLLLSLPFVEDLFLPQRKKDRIKTPLFVSLLTLSIFVQVLGVSFDVSRFIRLILKDVKPMGHGLYHRHRWPVRDDMLSIHFIPEFSPIAAHYWMFRYRFLSTAGSKDHILHNPPWKSLNPKWMPSSIDPQIIHFNFWWYYALFYGYENRFTALLIAMIFLVGAVLLFRYTYYVGWHPQSSK